MKIIKLLFAASIAFICAVLLGEFISFVIGFILPDSLKSIAWIFDGAVTAYGFFLLASIGAAFAYNSGETEGFIKSQKDMKGVMFAFIMFFGSLLLVNALRVDDEKRVIVSMSMVMLTIILYTVNFIRSRNNKAKSNNEEEPHEMDKGRKASDNEKDFWPILEAMYIKKEQEVKGIHAANWQERQKQAIQTIWLESIRYGYGFSCDSVDDYVKFILLLTEENPLPPVELDLAEITHYKYAQEVSFCFADFLRDKNDTTYPGCRIRPESVLPLPKLYIYSACNYFAECVDRKLFDSQKYDNQNAGDDIPVKEGLSNLLRSISMGLEDDLIYVPFDSSEVPVEPMANMKFYLDYRRNKAK